MVIEVTARLIVDGATSATYALPTASAGPVNSEGLFGHYHDRHVDSVDDSSLGDQQRQHVLREKMLPWQPFRCAWWIRRAILGSGSHHVVSHSPCPMVVVPTPQRAAKD